MANERKTENLVRKHFNKFLTDVDIEEQQSGNPKINKLLKTASKRGLGKGYPEFLITYKENSDLMIVVECKADISKHESLNRDKYPEYAVDGVLLYSSYLAKEFDVLAIAVSGESVRNSKVSHFLHLKGEKAPNSIFGDKLLSPADYLTGYRKSPEKDRQDHKSLLDFAKRLNVKLHTHKILEAHRSLLISGVLIALAYPAFRKSYADEKTPKSLAGALTRTVATELEAANIGSGELENLKLQFSFIEADTSLAKKHGVLKELIDDIDQNINQFTKTHKYIDVLSQLYIEFLRYANSDTGLGIVLTPPHITGLFSELAQVNKNSIIYDNCMGTGGFLISAMKIMIEDAKGDTKKIKEIKHNKLIGVEYQSHICALSVSNMYIHQDGKTNVINADCFVQKTLDIVKKKSPTIGFLNPPYKSDKKKDTDEIEFVLNNLECLKDGGTCIAIVPMQSALATKGKTYELKKKLLSEHTLEGVLSMPNELFSNSNVNVVSCVMVFTAHRKHPLNKETYFGYYKDDGFVKRKVQGRYDVFGSWEKIKEKWVSSFLNRKQEAGFSINKIVSADDEWVAEAYMETDYSKITQSDFEKTVRDYAIHVLSVNDMDES